jgi:hypothetical protein
VSALDGALQVLEGEGVDLDPDEAAAGRLTVGASLGGEGEVLEAVVGVIEAVAKAG